MCTLWAVTNRGWRNGHEDQQAQLGSSLKHRARTVRTDHRRNIKELLTQNRQG